MSELAIFLDLLAGVLVGINFLIPATILRKIETWLLRSLSLEVGSEPFGKKPLFFGIALTAFMLVGTLTWALLQDVGKGQFSPSRIAFSGALMFGGTLLGIAASLTTTWLLIRGLVRLAPDKSLVWGFMFGMGIAVAELILFVFTIDMAPPVFIPIGLGFILGSLLAVLGIEVAPFLSRYVTLQGSYALARVGLAIFIVNKIIQLIGLRAT